MLTSRGVLRQNVSEGADGEARDHPCRQRLGIQEIQVLRPQSKWSTALVAVAATATATATQAGATASTHQSTRQHVPARPCRRTRVLYSLTRRGRRRWRTWTDATEGMRRCCGA